MALKAKSYPKFKLKFYNNDKVVNSLRTKKPLRILYRIRRFKDKTTWNKAFLGFYYIPHHHNEGCFYNHKYLEHAFRCFMEILPEYKDISSPLAKARKGP